MAPKTIAIHRHKVDPVSPIPVRKDDFPKSKHASSRDRPTSKLAVPSIASSSRSVATQESDLDELKSKYEETMQQMEKMKRENGQNNKRLIEMSGLVKSLQDIPIGYDKSDGNAFLNVQRKIEAIQFEMKQAKKRYDELRDEKTFQTDTIKAQESHIKAMETQIELLNERLEREQSDQQEQQQQTEEKQKATDELEQQIMLQDMEIMNLMGEIDNLRKRDKVHLHNEKKEPSKIGEDIKFLEVNNAAKYAEIKKMEEKLAKMREEQREQKMHQQSFLKQQSEERSGFVLQPTATTFAEISKLEEDMATLRLEQEKTNIFNTNAESEASAGKKPPLNRRRTSQPWSCDLAWQDSILDGDKQRDAELEVIANNDITYDEPSPPQTTPQEQKSLNLPILQAKKDVVVQSARKPKGSSAFNASDPSHPGASNQNSQCDDSIFGESVEEAEEPMTLQCGPLNCSSLDKPKKHKNPFHDSKEKDHSDTSVTEGSTMSSPDECDTSQDDDCETYGSSSVSEHSSKERKVELHHSDDGSVEAIELGSRRELRSVKSETTDEGASDNESSVGCSSAESTNGDFSNDSSFGEYTSGESTRTESRSILEQIPEEGEELEESDSEWGEGNDSVSLARTREEQVEDLLLEKQLKDALDKYEKLMSDYNGFVSKSDAKMKTLEEENKKLRNSPSTSFKFGTFETVIKDSDDKKRAKRLKSENKMLLKNMEKQNDIMMQTESKYEKLKQEHLAIVEELEQKKKRYDQLAMEFTDLTDRSMDVKSYARLEALHQAVVMKLADIGEENDKLERERDRAVDLLESKNIQIRAFDQAIAESNKVETDLIILQEVHEETVSELQNLADQYKELKHLHDKETENVENIEALQQEYASAMAEMEILKKSNAELSGIDSKLNESEVRVTVLEGELKKSKEDFMTVKKKSSARQGQLRDVIAQYKKLKQEHSDTCAKLSHLEVAINGSDNEVAIKEMRKMEDALEQAKKNSQEAIEAKEAREGDMRIVLEYYEKLKAKFDKLQEKYDGLAEATRHHSENPVDGEEKKEDMDSSDGDYNQVEAEELEKLLKESKKSLTGKEEEINKASEELEAAREQIKELEADKEQLQVELSTMKSELLLARREANKAVERKDNGQDHLRTAITDHHRLQQTYSSLQKKFEAVQAELEITKQQANAHEQAEKQARKRATSAHSQYKKLQEDHDVVVERLEKLKIEMTISRTDSKQ
eukprot:CAMPEP_0172366370 /NCGR_PEP_ID=MMETSP1060-20121228/14791_1 /TAXON_ID=37318 /ORGANISM="Pseudo-nitzschia pungens, Strain cf. cingulata" /LENGTH=1220 /DNA_ID=CAMNT_0013090195 /DNA_START=92 /DNA_END=3754 /DNA_ORIENTATION=+